ncbi:unnamed protein product (mitochondrion) [Plasmodiophora brassicae]|uniref:Bardet-Biedl syndrome 7 protein n=1 Tax=Plasmodiophora brassicae TaxID=37360 RepID=A0A3P3YGY4_PLABS|nr:unnamed protein product [Plasmodiophora brassicae]
MDIQQTPCAVGQASSAVRNAMAVLPSAAHKEQKVVAGDRAGVVACWRLTNPANVEHIFRTPPGEREVTALALGGPRAHKDKVFIAYGHTVVGVKKNGKEFFKFATTLNEDIRHMVVDNVTIWASGEYVLNRFDNCVDTAFFMCDDVINHFTIEFDADGASPPAGLLAVLACQDSHIRVVNGANLVSEMAVCAPVTQVMAYPTPGSYEAPVSTATTTATALDGDSVYRGVRRILFGTSRGQLGQVLMGAGGTLLRQDFLFETRHGAVTCMTHTDLSNTGGDDVVVGFDCGTVAVYTWENGTTGSTLIPAYRTVFPGSISALDAGHITSVAFHEVVVVTYDGAVTLLRRAPPRTTDPSSSSSSKRTPSIIGAGPLLRSASSSAAPLQAGPGGDPRLAAEIAAVRAQLDDVTKQLNGRRAAYQQQSNELVAVETQFHVQQTFRLDPDLGAYVLAIEIEMPIDVVALRSDVTVMILNSSAIVSTSPSDHEGEMLATLRPVDSCNRATLQIRTLEGRSGDLKICIIPKLYPKTAQTVTIPIKPLSLHEKVPSLPPSKFAMNSIRFRGSFTLAQMHGWVGQCLPDVSGHVSQSDVRLTYRNVFLGSHLTCQYQKGEATFTSDSCSTISIIREVISKEATLAKVPFTMDVDLDASSVMSLVERIGPKVRCHTSLASKVGKVAALKEIVTQEGEDACLRYLSPEYVDILAHADDIQRDVAVAPRHLDFLRTMLTDLFVDVHRLLGRPVQQRLPDLQHALVAFDYDQVTAVFNAIH